MRAFAADARGSPSVGWTGSTAPRCRQDLAIAVVAVESDFDRNRNSPKGARGPMQLMPATAVRFGVSDPCEPAANIDAGVRYLGLLLRGVQESDRGGRRLQRRGGPHLRIWRHSAFPETVSYVAKVVNHQLGLPMPRRGRARGFASHGRRRRGRSRRRPANQASAVGCRRDAVLGEAFTGEAQPCARHLNQHRRSRERSC